MARKYLTNINLFNNQILNFKPEILASDPGSPQEGRVWYNSTSKKLKFYDGTTVQELPGSGGVADPLRVAGAIDASTNPNYPAADAGDLYYISVAGKIGGVSGPDVQAGDAIVCTTDSTASGDHATVGSNWLILQTNVVQATTSTPGYVELATSAEVQALADTERAVTPSGLGALGLWGSYSTDFSSSSGATITAATHGLSADKIGNVAVFEDGAPNAEVEVDWSIADNGDVIWAATSSFNGHIVIQKPLA